MGKGVPFLLHYVASKGAVNAMTKALAKELGGAGIRVNAVAPGFTLSDGVLANSHQLETLRDISLQARVLQRDQHPEDIVGAVVFFASEDSAFVTGQTLVVDGGAYFHCPTTRTGREGACTGSPGRPSNASRTALVRRRRRQPSALVSRRRTSSSSVLTSSTILSRSSDPAGASCGT